MATITVTDESFQADVIDSDKPVLLDYWATYCAPCKQMAPALEELSDEFEGAVTIGKMNIEDCLDVPSKFHIRGVPTLMIFKGGEVVATRVGPMNKAKMSEWITENT